MKVDGIHHFDQEVAKVEFIWKISSEVREYHCDLDINMCDLMTSFDATFAEQNQGLIFSDIGKIYSIIFHKLKCFMFSRLRFNLEVHSTSSLKYERRRLISGEWQLYISNLCTLWCYHFWHLLSKPIYATLEL